MERVVEVVAEYEGVASADLPALEDILDSNTNAKLTTKWRDQTEPINFTYIWYDIIVYPDGMVTVTP